MSDPPRTSPQRELLNSEASRRLLARAAELDAEQRAGSELERLRSAAAEAGISAAAFDAAVDEMRREADAPAPQPVAPRRAMRALIAGAVLASLLLGFAVMRVAPTQRPALAEQTFTLRCLTAGDAAELVRPLLEGPNSEVVTSPGTAPRTLRIRTTPQQMARVRALLEQRDGASCVVPPPVNR